MSFIFTPKDKNSENPSRTNTKLFHFILGCVISITLIQTSYAQLDSEQITYSNNMLNDPAVQDILKKIEQTKKMIAELEQKEYEKNQAQENLQKIRDMTVERLNQDLDEWERLWEKHSSRNSFTEFVKYKPTYVQAVFWDQFEFHQMKVNAGRIAMNQVLTNGGTMQDARNAYNNAASAQKIELIEMNAQFNVKHGLANYEEQKLFNSTGQIHISPTTQAKLSDLYSDYKTQPSYILANSDIDTETNSDTECQGGYVLVTHVASESHSCIDENIAKKWVNSGVKGISISGEPTHLSNVKTNPGTKCEEGHQVIYNLATLEYQCILESVAKEMINNNTAETHTLVGYILNKDKLKVYEDTIYQVNQEILKIKEEFNIKKKTLESKYDKTLENEDLRAKQEIQEIINEYRIGNITKEDVSKQISETGKTKDSTKEKILGERMDAINALELELKNRIAETVKGFENNSDINVNWDYLSQT